MNIYGLGSFQESSLVIFVSEFGSLSSGKLKLANKWVFSIHGDIRVVKLLENSKCC